MNAESVEPRTFAEQKPPREGWSFPRWVVFLALALAVHFALVFMFGAKKTGPPRVVANAPQLYFTEGYGENAALTDPTLFARPHEVIDFLPAAWRLPPLVAEPTIRWTEQPQFLHPAAENLGAAFNWFIQTNRLAMQTLNFKPEPQFTPPTITIEPVLPQNSSLKIIGSLAQRRLLDQINVPSIPCNDVLPPSKVQVLVEAGGTVVSTVLLESSEWPAADRKALELARTARFAPSSGAVLGEFIFTWHTVPTNAP